MKVEEYISVAKRYCKENINENIVLLEPIFRIEDNKIYFSYMITNFVDDNELEIIRPTHYLLQNIVNGCVEKLYKCEEHDFTTNNIIPKNRRYKNLGSSKLYAIENYIMKSLNKWAHSIKDEVNNKFIDDLYNSKIMILNNNLISSKEYINYNFSTLIKELENNLYNYFENDINNGVENYKNHLFNLVKQNYQNDNIDYKVIKEYIKLIKFLYPDFIELINAFSNIKDITDEIYDSKLKDSIIDKDEILKKIDAKIAELENDINE